MESHSPRVRSWLTQELARRLVVEASRALAPRARVMPIKGALLARALYADPAERPMTDCDVLAVGISFDAAVGLLREHGFVTRVWSRQRDVVVLATPHVTGLQLDLHTRPLPRGFGAVDAAWLARDASLDTSLFGAPVLIPSPARLLVHLLANITKDHVYRSGRHHARDVALLLERHSTMIREFASTARDARLCAACWMALEWVAEVEHGSRAREVQRTLESSVVRTASWRAQARFLREAARRDVPTLAARVMARAAGDRASDALVALGETALGVPRAWWLAQRERMSR